MAGWDVQIEPASFTARTPIASPDVTFKILVVNPSNGKGVTGIAPTAFVIKSSIGVPGPVEELDPQNQPGLYLTKVEQVVQGGPVDGHIFVRVTHQNKVGQAVAAIHANMEPIGLVGYEVIVVPHDFTFKTDVITPPPNSMLIPPLLPTHIDIQYEIWIGDPLTGSGVDGLTASEFTIVVPTGTVGPIVAAGTGLYTLTITDAVIVTDPAALPTAVLRKDHHVWIAVNHLQRQGKGAGYFSFDVDNEVRVLVEAIKTRPFPSPPASPTHHEVDWSIAVAYRGIPLFGLGPDHFILASATPASAPVGMGNAIALATPLGFYKATWRYALAEAGIPSVFVAVGLPDGRVGVGSAHAR